MDHQVSVFPVMGSTTFPSDYLYFSCAQITRFNGLDCILHY